MPIFKIELAGIPNYCIIKINKQKFRALLDSEAEVTLIHTNVYKSLKNKPKLKKQTALLQSVKGDSIDMDGCALLEYEIGKEKQEHEFFIVPQMNRKIILGRDWLKQFDVCMYYDLGCIGVGKFHIIPEEVLYFSSISRLTTETIIKLQSGKVWLCRVKGNEEVLNSKLHQVITAENSTLNQEPGLIVVNSIVKITKQGKFLALIINNTNKTIKLKQSSKKGKVEPIRECDFVNINNYSRPKKGTAQKASSA